MYSKNIGQNLFVISFCGFALFNSLGCSSLNVSPAGAEHTEKSVRYEIENLENGLKIYYVTDTSLPRLGIRALIKVGSKQDPMGKEGLTNLTGDLLTMGAGSWSATELAEQVSDLGSELGVVTGPEMTTMELDCIDKDRNKLIEVFKTILMAPSFKETEIRRAKLATLSQIQKSLDVPDNVANEEAQKLIFGEKHSYGRSTLGDAGSIRKMSRKDFIEQYFKYFRPNNTVLAVSGNINPEIKSMIRSAFAGWSKKQIPENKMEEIKVSADRQLKIISKSGLEQTQIRIGHTAITRHYPNYLAYKVALEVLGGGFESRLNSQIRTKLGLTYSIDAEYEPHLQSGLFVISTFTKHASVLKTTQETLKLYEDFVQAGINEKELQDAKAQLLGNFPRLIETSDRYAGNIVSLDFYGVPLDYLENFSKSLKAVTLEQVNSVIKSEFRPQNVKIIIYTDKAKIKDQLPDLEKVAKP